MKQHFVTAVNCIDGRTQEPLIGFIKRKFSAEYIDLVTELDPDKILSENKQKETIKSIKNRVSTSIEKHNSKILIIAGHHDCAANPVEKEEHYKQLKKAVQNLKEWNLEIDVYSVWLGKDWEAVLL